MKDQPSRRLNTYTPRALGFLGLATVEPIAQAIHRRAKNNRKDRGSATAIFIDRGSLVFAFDLDSLTADLWMRDRFDQLLAVIDPAPKVIPRPEPLKPLVIVSYSVSWLESTLREHLGGV